MLDGLSATPYPSGVRNVPVEISEAITPIAVWRKEWRKDSGGIGEMRGGLGQTMEITSRDDAPFGIFASFERVLFPARGRDGGGAVRRQPHAHHLLRREGCRSAAGCWRSSC